MDSKKRKLMNLLCVLPNEIIVDILSRVGAADAEALFACKLTCKAINAMSKDKKIYQNVSFETLYIRSWRIDENASKNFDLCFRYNNPEAVLCYGMVQYFTYVLLDEGMKNIELASTLGNTLATYLSGLLLICNGDEERKNKGVHLLLGVFHRHGIMEVVELRKKIRTMMVSLWLNNKVVVPSTEIVSCDNQHNHEDHTNWETGNFTLGGGDLNNLCDSYICNREARFFLSLLN